MSKTLRDLLEIVKAADDAHSLAQQATAQAKQVLDAAEEDLFRAMEEQQTDIMRMDGLTVTLVEKSRPQVDDWEVAYKTISKHPQLLERRVAAKAFAELLEQRRNKPIPGFSTYEYKALTKRRN